ncbi:DUF4837 family protein [Flavobacterium jejuense]|uniref:DUF4837 family protein n=1 Tax=Flavobacterium jejuense TaxID=1544455 RepID=A0ABX0IR61_9FLAO|nr:DUF4837 family protein [Flavobacterium jejuense]NHN25555.1 DUF4837 family protein [Flavobacterium jejuense]
MKHLFITFLSLIILISCKESEADKKAVLTESNGKINNVSIIMDENLWNGEIGDSIRKKFAAPIDGFINEEPMFTLNQYPSKIFEGFVRNSRNIIVVEKSDQSGFSAKKDEFAKPQQVFYIVGKTKDEILATLEKKANEIIQAIKEGEIIENQIRLKKAAVTDAKVRERFGVALTIGYGYKYDMVEDDFLWIRKEFNSGYNSILVYEMPINVIENDSNVVNNIVKMRDSIGKKFIHGTLDNTWMVTEEAYSPLFFDVSIAGRKTYETKGNWYLKNDFMAGPFLNYAIKDTKNNRFLVLEGFTYNPSKSKRDLVFELEAIIKSVKFLK